MFVVRISKEKQLFDVKLYNFFQNALAGIADKSIFNNIPKELEKTLGKVEMKCFGKIEENGIADDFEFRYENGVTVYIGELFAVDN